MTRMRMWMALAAAVALTAAASGTAQEITSNNLSYPAVFVVSEGQTIPLLRGVEGEYTLAAPFGGGMSWGCDKPDAVDQYTYPNTSCRHPITGELLSPEACVLDDMPCFGFQSYELQQMYWQQDSDNAWQAEWVQVPQPQGTPDAVPVTHVDWGDNLETVTWSERSIVRVETTPFTTLDAMQRGFQMWHVADQGPDEMWGVRATSTGEPFVYASPYAIVHGGAAVKLNITKISGSAVCPTAEDPGTGSGFTGSWSGSGWEGQVFEFLDGEYGAELNIGGKFVYGYNWNLKKAVVPPAFGKTGWWRLTFYTSPTAMTFASADIPLSPPVLPPASPDVPTLAAETVAPLYAPVVDPVHNITYIDVCVGQTRGGGKGGGKGGG